MKEELEQLAQQAGELAQQAIKGEGNTTVAQFLDGRLTALQAEAQQAPGLWRRWLEARRYLDVALAAMQPRPETIPEQANRLSLAAFRLAQQMAAGQASAALHEEARDIDGQLRTLTPDLGNLTAAERTAVERAITDAQLDILYVLADGKAPTSIRLFHFQQAQSTNG